MNSAHIELRKKRNDSKASPMFINDLPPEILAKILHLLINYAGIGRRRRDYDPGYIIRNRYNREPLAFARVCRYWRAVAFSIKTVWASFCGEQFKPVALANWARLSKPLPLHLTLCPRSSSDREKGIDDRTLKASRETLDQFSVFANRWGSLYFIFDHCELTEALADMLQSTAPRSPLRRFEIRMYHHDTPQIIINKLVSAIASFPSLRHFCWIFNSPESYLPRAFPWHSLEDLYVESSLEVEDFIWCLMQCTSARVVTLLGKPWGNKRGVTGAFKGIHSTLPRLESLTINVFCDPYRFLQHFTLPSLVSLEIQTLNGFSNALQEFLIRSQCPLLKFTVRNIFSMTDEEVIVCLLTPYLRPVPVVAVSIFDNSRSYLAQLVQAQPNILYDLPGLTAWYDETGHNIGWKKTNSRTK